LTCPAPILLEGCCGPAELVVLEKISLGEKLPAQAPNSRLDPATMPASQPGNPRADAAARACDCRII
jgi:hypothetical protein